MTRSRPSPKSAATALALGLALTSVAPAETSPLSVLPEGYGLEVSGLNAREKAMGEAGMASVNKMGPSIPNPSRTAWNEKTSFSATFDSDLDWLRDEDRSNRSTTFLIPDIALNFQTRLPLNFGLYYRQRFHRNFSFTPEAQSDSEAVQSFSTEGGLYELSATVAYAPLNWLAVSVGYNFLLGRDRYIESATFDQNSKNPDLFNGANLKGDTVSVRSTGAYPSVSLTVRQKTWSLAAAASLEADLDRTLTRGVTAVSSAQKSTDTRTLPWSMQVGAAYKPAARQTLAADFAWESWDESGNDALNPAFKAGLGYEFQGSGTTYEAYYRKMALRGGLGFERLYLDETNQYYVTLGTGLPLGRRGNMLDIALKYGHRGDLENNLWTEDFLKVSATLTGVSVWGQPVRKRR